MLPIQKVISQKRFWKEKKTVNIFIMKFDSETKSIAIGTALGVGIGVVLKNFTLGLVIGIVFTVFLIKKNKDD